WQYEEFCQIGLSYLLLTLPRAKGKARRFVFHLLLAVYFWTGNQMLGIFPVLLYGAIAIVLERDRDESVPSFLGRCFGGWSTLVPIASMALLCYATFVLRQGHLFHALYQKRHVPGFYVGHWFEDIHN